MGSITNSPNARPPMVNDLVGNVGRLQNMRQQALTAAPGTGPTIADLVRGAGQNLQLRDAAMIAPSIPPAAAPSPAPAPAPVAQGPAALPNAPWTAPMAQGPATLPTLQGMQQVGGTVRQALAAPAGSGGPTIADIIRQIRMLQAQGG